MHGVQGTTTESLGQLRPPHPYLATVVLVGLGVLLLVLLMVLLVAARVGWWAPRHPWWVMLVVVVARWVVARRVVSWRVVSWRVVARRVVARWWGDTGAGSWVSWLTGPRGTGGHCRVARIGPR